MVQKSRGIVIASVSVTFYIASSVRKNTHDKTKQTKTKPPVLSYDVFDYIVLVIFP